MSLGLRNRAHPPSLLRTLCMREVSVGGLKQKAVPRQVEGLVQLSHKSRVPTFSPLGFPRM